MKIDMDKINLRRLVATRKFLIKALGLAALSLTVIAFSIFPQIAKIFEIQTDITKERKSLNKLQVKLSSLEDAQTLQLVENAQVIDKALPSYKPLLELMAGINYVAQISGVGIENIELTPGLISTESAQEQSLVKKKQVTNETQGYKNLSVKLKIAGTISQINSFLSQAERISPLVNVNKIVLSENSRSDNFFDVDFEAEVEVMTYYFTKSVKAAVNDPLPQAAVEHIELIDEVKKYYVAKPDQQINIQGGGSDNLFGFEQEFGLETIN